MSKNQRVKKSNVNINIVPKKKQHIKEKREIRTKIMCLIDYGREEITTKEQLEKYAIGSLISYINKNNIFKIGGFILKFEDEYFIYITSDFTTKYKVRYTNIQKMWVGDVYKVRNDIISLAKATQEPTNFPVKIGKNIVYYASNSFFIKRFMSTDKFKIMMEWYNYFKKNKNAKNKQ